MSKTLSIVVASYNTKDLTLACINSITKLETKLDYEIIVVDDGSDDESYQVLKEIEREKRQVRVILNKENSGYVKTNNKGIEASTGKYILLLNSDTVVKKGALEALVKFAQGHSDAGVIGAKLLNSDGSVQPSCYRLPTIKNAIYEFWFGKKGLFEKYAPVGDSPSEVEALVGAVFLITSEALKKVGKLNTAYKSYFEDLDYCRKVRKYGLKVYYLPSAEIIHYHGASFAKLAGEKDQWKKLIPSSKIYHGVFRHSLINAIIWIGQKWALTKKTLFG